MTSTAKRNLKSASFDNVLSIAVSNHECFALGLFVIYSILFFRFFWFAFCISRDRLFFNQPTIFNVEYKQFRRKNNE